MHGLSTQSKEQIDKVVGDLFDKAALRLLGPIPKLHHKKITLLGFLEGATLATLFVQAMNNRYLNNTENDVLKGILGGAFGYIETLRVRLLALFPKELMAWLEKLESLNSPFQKPN